MLLLIAFTSLISTEVRSFSIFGSRFQKTSVRNSWQEDVDTILNIDTECDSRRNIAFGLLDKAKQIQEDFTTAIQDRDIKKIAPSNLKYGKAVEGIQAVQRQFINDILPDLFTKSIPKAFEKGPSAISEIIKIVPETAKEIISTAQQITKDPSVLQSTVDDVRKEARNIFLSTPEGLETPSYSVLKSTEAFEIRSYTPFSVISTKVVSDDLSPTSLETEQQMLDPINSGTGFNTLASYIFGKNSRKEKLSMTTPVITQGGTMQFVLPSGLTFDTAPTPDIPEIKINDIPAELVAVREFPGIATEGEVSRQRAYLEDSLLTEGIIYDNLTFKVLQYNPPFTLPWLRRNEVSVKVTYSASSGTGSSNDGPSAPSMDGSVSPAGSGIGRVSGNNSGSSRVEGANDSNAGDASAFFTSPEAGD